MRPLPLLLLAVLLCLPALTAAQPFAYTIDSDGQTTADDLYRLDLATGAVTRIGPVRPSVGPAFQDVEGLALSPAGELFGVDDALDALIRIDTASGQATLVGALGTSGQGPNGNLDYGLAFTCDGRLWLSSDTTATLWEVDPGTGLAQAPRTLPAGIGALAGRGLSLAGLGVDGNLHQYVPSTGQTTLIGATGLTLVDDGGLDFDADGNLWAVLDFTPSDPDRPSEVHRLDRTTGLAQWVASTRIGFEGLAIAPATCAGNSGGQAESVPGPGMPVLVLLAGVLALFGWRQRARA